MLEQPPIINFTVINQLINFMLSFIVFLSVILTCLAIGEHTTVETFKDGRYQRPNHFIVYTFLRRTVKRKNTNVHYIYASGNHS